MKNRKDLIRGLTVVAVLIVLILVFVFRVRHDMEDFSVNFEAGKRLRVAETLYRYEDEHYQFKYLPASAILYAPLTMFPLPVAKAIWYVLILVCTGLLIFISYKLLTLSKEPIVGKKLFIWLVPFLVLLKYFFREWDLGQINTVVTVVLLLMISSLLKSASSTKPESIKMASSGSMSGTSTSSRSKRQELLAGVLWGLSVALKPYAAIFLLYLVLKQKWKAVFSGLIALGVAVLLPAFYYGLQGNLEVHKEWITTLSKSTPHLLTTQDNISLIALSLKWFGDQTSSFWIAVTAIAGLALMIFGMILLGWKREQTTFMEGAALLMCIPLVSPLGWDYTLIMGLPLLMIVLYHFPRFSRFWQVVLIVNLFIIFVTFYDAMGAQAYELFMSWSVPTINFLLILAYALHLRVQRVC